MAFWRAEFKQDDIEEIFRMLKRGRSSQRLPDSLRFIEFGDLELLVSGRFGRMFAILVSAIDCGIDSDTLKTRIIRDTIMSEDLPIEFTQTKFREVFHTIKEGVFVLFSGICHIKMYC